MRKLILALCAVAFIAAPASAAVQNVQVKGGINQMGLMRENFDLDSSVSDDEQAVAITQATLEISADLTDQVRALIGIINERVWENDNSNSDTDMDIYRAWLEIREALYSPLTLKIGRFDGNDWFFGNSFIFNAAGPNTSAPSDSNLRAVAGDLTLQTALDGVRGIFDFNPLVVEVFYAAISEGATQRAGETDDDAYLFGLYSTYELGDDLDSVIDLYFFNRIDKTETTGGINPPGPLTASDTGQNQVDRLKILGGRISTNPIEGINIQGELAWQSGTKVNPGSNGAGNNASATQDRNAWGFQGIVNYQIPSFEEYDPVLTYRFTKVYGDSGPTNADSTNQDYTAWDPFFEGQSTGRIYNALFSLSDMIIHEATLTMNPMEDVTLALSYAKLWRHEKHTSGTFSLLQPDDVSGTTTSSQPGSRELGQEVDVEVWYDYTEDVQFGLNIGVFKPSDVFENQENAKQVIANVNVAF